MIRAKNQRENAATNQPVPFFFLFQVRRNTDDRLEIGANWMRSAEITRGSLDATQLAATLMLEGPSCGLPQTRTLRKKKG